MRRRAGLGPGRAIGGVLGGGLLTRHPEDFWVPPLSQACLETYFPLLSIDHVSAADFGGGVSVRGCRWLHYNSITRIVKGAFDGLTEVATL